MLKVLKKYLLHIQMHLTMFIKNVFGSVGAGIVVCIISNIMQEKQYKINSQNTFNDIINKTK